MLALVYAEPAILNKTDIFLALKGLSSFQQTRMNYQLQSEDKFSDRDSPGLEMGTLCGQTFRV